MLRTLKLIEGPIHEYAASTVEEFWDALSPLRYLLQPGEKLIYRGQADADWKLEPSLLRKNNSHHVYSAIPFRLHPEQSEYQIVAEIHSLRILAEYCDSTGLSIPGDSAKFREQCLNPQNRIDSFIRNTGSWPSDEYFNIMALAQHYGLPTRLLDWSRYSHVAAYFAASSALRRDVCGRLAVWALNTEARLWDVAVVRLPGSNNPNIAAQSGRFTLLRQAYREGKPFEGTHCVDEYLAKANDRALIKVTLRASEAPKLLDLCERHGISAATLHPDFYGAAKATLDRLRCESKAEWTDGRDVRANTLPVPTDDPGS